MMKRQTLSVTLEQPGTDDLLEFIVQTDNRDMVRWDLSRNRYGWPAVGDAPVLWATVTSYYALIRSGKIKGMTVEEFIDRAIDVRYVKPDGTTLTADDVASGEGATDVDPSRPGAEPGY